VKSRWQQLLPFTPDTDYLVLASNIPARSWGSTGRLFKGSQAVKRQLHDTPGVVGYSLLARPVRKHYATLSVWSDAEALRAFSASSDHGRLMVELGPEMAPTRFVRWTIRGDDGVPSWRDALRRLADPG